jgi:hypothetical protein
MNISANIADVGLPLPTPHFVYIGGLCVACSFGLGWCLLELLFFLVFWSVVVL